MKCVSYAEFGPPAKVLQVLEKALPKLKDQEARVTVLAAPVNPADVMQIAGLYGVKPPLPAVAGLEGIGKVAEVGSKVTSVKPGDLAILPPGSGTWTSEIIVEADSLLVVPPGTDVKQVAMMMINPMTAMLLIDSLKKGDWVIQTAAGSAVGQYVIQFAKEKGVKTVNVVRSQKAVDEVKARGGDVVLMDSDNLVADIAKATSGAKINLAIDPVSGPIILKLGAALAPGGTIVNYGALTGGPLQVSPGDLIFRDIKVKGFWVQNWFVKTSASDKAAAIQKLVAKVQSGELKADIDSTYPLDKVQEAIVRANTPGRNGKVLLLPNGAV